MTFIKIAVFTFLSFIFVQCSGRNTQQQAHDSQLSDGERFALEYPLVSSDNIFVFRNAEETADILANGRGIVFIGFKECPWCQLYVVFLHDVAREMGIERVYYLDIREDRQNNTESYQRIVGILSNRLQYDDEGRPRVYVPDLSIVNNGRIILRDFETSKETLGYSSPEEYWNEERVDAFKEKLRGGIMTLKQFLNRPCEPC
jgi:hypothetical protein